MNATNGNINANGQLEQQLFELIYGLLEPDEALALRRRVTSEPEVARAYARVVQQSERLALAAQWEEPPLPLAALLDTAARGEKQPSPAALAETPALGTVIQLPASAPATSASSQPAAKKKSANKPAEEIVPAERVPGALRWLAAIAGGMVAAAVLVAACLVPRAGAGGGVPNLVDSPPLVRVMVFPPGQLAQGDNTLVPVWMDRAGKPAQAEKFAYWGVNGRGEQIVSGRGETDVNGSATFSVPGPADGTEQVKIFVEAEGSPPVEGQIEMVPAGAPRDGLNIETDRPTYTVGGKMQVRVWPVDKTKDLAELDVVAVDARGLRLPLDNLALHNEVVTGEVTIPVNSVPGLYDVRAERRVDGEVASRSISVRESLDTLRDETAKGDFVVATTALGAVAGGSGAKRSESEENKPAQADRPVEEVAEVDEELRVKLGKEVKDVKRRLAVVQDESGRVLDSQVVPATEGESREPHQLSLKAALSAGRGVVHYFDASDLDGSAPATPQTWHFQRTKEQTFYAHLSDPVEVADREVTLELATVDGRNQPLPTTRYGLAATFQRSAEGVETALGLGGPASGPDADPRSESYASEYAQVAGQGRGGPAASSGGQGLGGGGLSGGRQGIGGFGPSGKLAEGLVAESRGGADAGNERFSGITAKKDLAWDADFDDKLIEDQVALVRFKTHEVEALTRFSRLFPAGESPPSFAVRGDSLVFAEQRLDTKIDCLVGVAPWQDFSRWKDLANRESETRAGRPGLQVLSNGASLEKLRRADKDSGLAQPSPSEPMRWTWIFLAAGGGVMLLGTAISWIRRPDPWAVWLPFGLVAVACFAAGGYHGWPSESTATQVVTAGATPPAAAVLPAGGEEWEEKEYKTFAKHYATPEPASAYTPVQFRQLAVVPRFDAGDAPSNAGLFDDLGANLGDLKANEPPLSTTGSGPAESTPAEPKPLPIAPVNPTDEPLSQPPRTPALAAPEKKPGPGDRAEAPPNGPIATPGPSVPGGVPLLPLGEAGAKDPARLADGFARDYGNEPAPVETLKWDPAAETDARGRAQVRLKLPPGPGYYKVRVTADRGGEVVTTERIFKVK